MSSYSQTSHQIDYKIHGEEMQCVEIELDPQETAIAESGAFMMMDDGIQMQTIFGDGSSQQKGLLGKLWGAGKRLLTGESLFMTAFTNISTGKQKVAFVHAGGHIIERDLNPGEMVKIDTGCIVAFTPSIDYDIQFVGGIKNTFFGGEGLFFATLRGPGKVWIQSLPISRLAGRILAYGSYKRKEEGSLLGGIGNVLDGDG